MRISRLSKEALRTAVASMSENKDIRMRLGLDGDCDFTRRVTTYHSYRCRKSDLLELIEAQPEGRLRAMRGDPGYLVLSRRHAVCLADIFGMHAELAVGCSKAKKERQAG